jgi:hypothetical protein
MRAAVAAGSLIRWTAPPTLPTTCRCSVSPSLLRQDDILAGFVLAPLLGELFVGVKDQGAQLNGTPISVSATQTLAESLAGHRFSLRSSDHIRSVDGAFRQVPDRQPGGTTTGIGSPGSMLCGHRPLRRLLGAASQTLGYSRRISGGHGGRCPNHRFFGRPLFHRQ